MASQRFPRKSRQQWQALISQWQHSGQDARHFCSEQGLGYTTFCKWQRRFAEPPTALDSLSPFVEVSTLMSAPTAVAGRWHIVLSLGNGVELRLSQA